MSAEYPVVGNKVQVGPDLIPLSVIESWPKPNYVDPPTHFPTVIIWAAVFGSIAMVASCARIWSRFRLQRNAGLDDWLYLASLPFAASLVALSIMCNTRYYDKHIWDLPPKDAKPSANIAWWLQMEYLLVTGFIKQSILVFYLRITTRTVSRPFRMTVWACIVVQALTTLIWFFLTLFECYPVSAYWERFNITSPMTDYVCKLDGAAPIISMSIISVVQDIITAMLPLLVLRKLKISKRQKYALSGMFLLAFGIVGTALGRLATIFKAYLVTYDLTWQAYNVWTASMIEVLVALTVSSMPSLKYYFRNFFDESKSSTKSRPKSGTTDIKTGLSDLAKTNKRRTMSYISTSFSEGDLAKEPFTKETQQTSVLEFLSESSGSPSPPTTDIEAQWGPESAFELQRTPACIVEELRKTGIIKQENNWHSDLEGLQQPAASRQEQRLGQDSISKNDAWSQSQRDGVVLEGRSAPFVERKQEEAGTVKPDEWYGWEGGKLPQQQALETQLLADGILTPRCPPRAEKGDYFTGFEPRREAEKGGTVAKEPLEYGLAQ